MTSWLHQQRLGAVEAVLAQRGVARLLDLGCGDGDLLRRIAIKPALRHIVAVDIDPGPLSGLRHWLAQRKGAQICQVDILESSLLDLPARYAGFECAVLVEVIEHLPPGELARLERSLFGGLRPDMVVVTTPNAEFNALLGVPTSRMRHKGHRFEWDRPTFRAWAEGVGQRNGYGVACSDIAGAHPLLGGASQMAVFDLAAPRLSS